MKTKRLILRSLVLTSSLILGLTTAGLVQSGEHDMPDEISAADAGVRDDDKNQDKSIKQRLHMQEGAKPKSTTPAIVRMGSSATNQARPNKSTAERPEARGALLAAKSFSLLLWNNGRNGSELRAHRLMGL